MQQLQVQPTRDQRLQMMSLMMTLLFVFLAAADTVHAAAAVAPGRRVQSKTAATSCTDSPGFTDKWGTCAMYATQYWCTKNGTPGTGWKSAWGTLSAGVVDACCACGKTTTPSPTTVPVAVPVAVTAAAASCTDELGEGNCVRYTRGGLQTMCSHVPDHSDEWGFDLRNYTYVGGKPFSEYCPKTCKRCSANDPDAARAAITALCGHGNEVRGTAVNNGSYRDNNATACTPCAAGTIDHDTNSSTPCTICGAGTFSEASSTACSVCTCAAGTYGTNPSGSQNKSLPQSAAIEVRRQTQICLSPSCLHAHHTPYGYMRNWAGAAARAGLERMLVPHRS